MTAAQVTPLTIDDIYSYEGWTRFNGSQAATMAWVPAGDPWLNDTEHLWPSDAAHSSAGAERRAGHGCAWTRPQAPARRSTRTSTSSARSPTRASVLRRRGTPLACARRTSTRRAMRSSSRIGDDLYTFNISTGRADRADQLSRTEARGDVQPGRPQRRVRQEQQSVRGTSRRPRREGPHVGWQRRHPERHARLGLFRRAVRSRQSPRVLVESRLVAHRVSAIRRTRGPGIHAWSTTSLIARASTAAHYPKAGDPNPAVRLGVVSPSAGTHPLGRHHAVLRFPRRQCRLDPRQSRRGVSGSEPNADVARPQSRRCRHGSAAASPEGNEQDVGRTMAGFERRSALVE